MPSGQPGHPHHKRKRQDATRTVEIPAPEEVVSSEEYLPTGKLIRRQVIILHVTTEVAEYVRKVTGKRFMLNFRKV